MKLTKGKISKLLNKERQSRKKQKKNRKHKQIKNAKTFRRKRPLNLSNKTLRKKKYKKFKGGEINEIEIENENENKEKEKEKEKDITPVTTIPSENDTQMVEDDMMSKPVTNPFLEIPEKEQSDSSLAVPTVEPVINSKPIVSLGEEPVIPEPITIGEPETSVASPEVEPGSVVEPGPPEVEPGSEVEPGPPEVEPGPPEVEPEETFPLDEKEEEEEKQPPPPPIPQNSKDFVIENEGLPEEVSKSINTVVNYVTNEIASKIMINTNTNQNATIQNGFDAVNEANDKFFTQQNGGKKQKKFRLTKKSRSQAKSKSK